MGILRRNCVEYMNGQIDCYAEDSFWYTDKGIIVKWVILAAITTFFLTWFIGGYTHAKSRLRKGKPLLAYHRWLVSPSTRHAYGQGPPPGPQNHFSFYAQNGHQPPHPYYGNPNVQPQWQEPPPRYYNDAPPVYGPPAGASKVAPMQGGGGVGTEMSSFGAGGVQGGQESGVVGSSAGPVGGAGASAAPAVLPPRPETAKMKIRGVLERFKR